MFSFFPKSKHHYLKKDAKSVAELGQTFRNRMKNDNNKLFHTLMFWVFLMFAFRVGTIIALTLYEPNKFGLTVKEPTSKTKTYFYNSSSRNIYIAIDSRQNIVIQSNGYGIRINKFNEITESILFLKEKYHPNKIMIAADYDAKMYPITKILNEIKKLNNEYHFNIVLVTR